MVQIVGRVLHNTFTNTAVVSCLPWDNNSNFSRLFAPFSVKHKNPSRKIHSLSFTGGGST